MSLKNGDAGESKQTTLFTRHTTPSEFAMKRLWKISRLKSD
jgi:hypothetical protein